MLPVDLIWTIVGFVLTLMILSYLFGDNPLFRLATYLFVGVAAGYVLVVVVQQVLLPKLVAPLFQGQLWGFVPLLLGVLLLMKLSPRLAKLGNIPLAYLVGVGAAVAISGAILGTIATQLRATIGLFGLRGAPSPITQLLEGVFFLVGTVSTLIYFQFGEKEKKKGVPQKRSLPMRILAGLGQIFLAITLGALFAGVFTAALTALVERLDFLWTTISGWMV